MRKITIIYARENKEQQIFDNAEQFLCLVFDDLWFQFNLNLNNSAAIDSFIIAIHIDGLICNVLFKKKTSSELEYDNDKFHIFYSFF